MLATERAAFGKLVEALLAGYHQQPSDAKLEAYWRGCNSMHLLAFERTVDFTLGPKGEEDLPTPRQMHGIHRRLLADQRAGSAVPTTPPREFDVFERYSNRLFLAFLRSMAKRRGSGATDASLLEMIACKRRFQDGYREMCREEPEASLDLRDALIDALEPLYVPRVVDETPERDRFTDDCWQRVA